MFSNVSKNIAYAMCLFSSPLVFSSSSSLSTMYDALQDGNQVYLARALSADKSEVVWFKNNQQDAHSAYTYHVYVEPDALSCTAQMKVISGKCLFSYGNKGIKIPFSQLILDAFYNDYDITEHSMLSHQEAEYLITRYFNRSRYTKVFRALNDRYFKFDISLEQLLNRNRVSELDSSFRLEQEDAAYLLPVFTANVYNSFNAYDYEAYQKLQDDVFRLILKAQDNEQEMVQWVNVYLDLVQNLGRIILKISKSIDQVIGSMPDGKYASLTSDDKYFLLNQQKKLLGLYFKSLKLLIHDDISQHMRAVILKTGRVQFNSGQFKLDDIEMYQELLHHILATKKWMSIQDYDQLDGKSHMQTFESELYYPWYNFEKSIGALYLPYAVTQGYRNQKHQNFSQYVLQKEIDILAVAHDNSAQLMHVLQSQAVDRDQTLLQSIQALSGVSFIDKKRVRRWFEVQKNDLEIRFELDDLLGLPSKENYSVVPSLALHREVDSLFDLHQGALLDKDDLSLLVQILNEIELNISSSREFGSQQYSALYLFHALQQVMVTHIDMMIDAIKVHFNETSLTREQKNRLLTKIYYLHQVHISNFTFYFSRLDVYHYPISKQSVMDYLRFLDGYVDVLSELKTYDVEVESVFHRLIPATLLIDYAASLSYVDASDVDKNRINQYIQYLKQRSVGIE
tara:strand:+ start:4551 stop:6593 length:2043 start_codon:yes stop_codon:yes gene_type:complete